MVFFEQLDLENSTNIARNRLSSSQYDQGRLEIKQEKFGLRDLSLFCHLVKFGVVPLHSIVTYKFDS